ncbi:hypothetical protein M413DRAFT_448087 [Hebeloma cylindrosporum]|uniref:Glycosyltransferase 61 catalytic domain-containing protein n=1 Tax=Hebeloma cylindrosporum TaxID=76867 RepID=A0A0C3BN04_HEBCY|nr:hypothetical protein M413DRAFT_448087 [Hebeloma cylindrosporum h7]
MLARRQKIIIALITGSAFLLFFSSSPQLIDHVANVSMKVPYSPWAGRVDCKGEGAFHLQDHSKTEAITETTLPGGAPAPGFTIFDRLYIWNGTMFAVTSNPRAFPQIRYILSQPKEQREGNNLEPTSREMQIITPAEAAPFLGERAVVIEGMTFILYDTSQFMAHYYHWWGEIILGAMRIYSTLSLVPGVRSPLPDPSRFILPNIPDHEWRDRAGVNGPLMRAAFPSTSIERMDFWQDLVDLNQTFVFERAMIVSRSAAHRSPLSTLWYKMISSTMNVTVPTHFWEPLRQRLVLNTVAYLPVMNSAGAVISNPPSQLPIVTYISRQGGGRRLTRESHDGLVKSLNEMSNQGLFELHILRMETLTFSQQVEAVARSTIILGVHGNGLTHQLWMPPSPHSTVIEMFFPGAYIHDYEILARNSGHKHYAVWNDTTLTYPDGEWFKGVDYGPENTFNGNSIPVHGPTVTQVIRERLTSPVL